ncbi:MAG: hypothetical protein U5L72_12565 [Bacteroidales bacterium]|nr:hypothetical protein [Bacteroidales bacterium]
MNKAYMYQLYVYSLENKTINCLSNGLFHDFNPVFTKDGEHLRIHLKPQVRANLL